MSFRVETTARAEADRQTCYDYIFERSPQGAARWADAYDDALESLERFIPQILAPESVDHDEEIRQKRFRTKQGLWYRLLFVVRSETIYVVHVRGPGQNLMDPGDVELLEGAE